MDQTLTESPSDRARYLWYYRADRYDNLEAAANDGELYAINCTPGVKIILQSLLSGAQVADVELDISFSQDCVLKFGNDNLAYHGDPTNPYWQAGVEKGRKRWQIKQYIEVFANL